MSDRFFIGPFDKDSGLQNNWKPWLIPNNAFAELNNVYNYKERIRKRFGSRWLGNTQLNSRLRIKIGTTNAAGATAGVFIPYRLPLVPPNYTPIVQAAVGQMFSVGDQTFTVNSVALPTAPLLRSGINLGTTDHLTGNITVVILNWVGAIGQYFRIDNITYTINNIAPGPQNLVPSAPILGTATFDTATNTLDLTLQALDRDVYAYSNPATVATIDTSTGTPTSGQFVVAGTYANTDIYFYPSRPVMGLPLHDTLAINYEDLIGFDDRFAYINGPNGWERSATEAAPNDSIFEGTNSQFFWATNWHGTNVFDKIMYVTNGNPTETNFMRQFDGTTWSSYRPILAQTALGVATAWIDSCLMLIPYNNYMIALSPWITDAVGTNHFQNRVCWTKHSDPVAATGWRQDIVGCGNYADAATNEAIISCQLLKGQLIVKFEHSTYILRWLGNGPRPFRFEQINNEFGCESTFSMVPFDKVALAVGDIGVTADNTMSVERIDDKIPLEVFKIHNYLNSPKRVYGIRDYYAELVYWSFPDNATNATFPYPNRVLVYNYKNGTWAFNDDSITCFGYRFDVSPTGVTWNSTTVTWNDDIDWGAGSVSARAKNLIAGNQQGYTFIIDADGAQVNAPVLQITNITNPTPGNYVLTCPQHNLKDGDYVHLDGITGTGTISTLNGQIVSVTRSAVDPANILEFPCDAYGVGTYAGSGTMARVSYIYIKTKQYNFYVEQGRDAIITKINFMMDRTIGGKINIDYYTSTMASPAGTTILETSAYPTMIQEQLAERVWHPIYVQASGECIQFEMYLDHDQMIDPLVRIAPFQLNAFVIEATPGSYNLI